ncbi:MAG: DNA-directed RNA polymerase subunit E'' [Candidatus Aenigmarchaeota archaeon]|nr:DNA-directed RNA polymerase subunit E'' [Candidatus Aenigmarchaeota archaeon]
MADKVCRTCRRFVKESVCPVCKGTSFSWSWKGIVVVNDPNDSSIAKHMGITVPGKYCILMK